MLQWGCVALAAALGGFSRGFAAFGTAMIYVPLATMAYDARTAVVTLFLVDLIPALPLVWKAAPKCDGRTMLWMGVGAVALTPVGVAFLVVADRAQAQLAVAVILLAAVTLMVARPTRRIGSTAINSIAAGAVSGLAGGICAIFGPPATLYLLGRGTQAAKARADIIVFLTAESLVLGATYLVYGLYTLWDVELSLALLPIYGLSTWYGAHRFSRMREATYRRVVVAFLWLVAAALVVRSMTSLGS